MGSFPDEWKPPAAATLTSLPLPTNTVPFGNPPVFPGLQLNQTPPQPAALTLKEKLAHIHHIIKGCFGAFHQKFKGRVMLKKCLDYSNATWDQLPVLDKYVDQTNNRNRLCYNHVLGYCNMRKCRFDHAPASDVTDLFAH
jgi:hypothetical protein